MQGNQRKKGPGKRPGPWLLWTAALVLVAGCDSTPVQEAYPSHFAGEDKGLTVLTAGSTMPEEVIASLPMDFQLAEQTGNLTLVLDGNGLIKRPYFKLMDFLLVNHNRAFGKAISGFKEQGLEGYAPPGFPYIYALKKPGPVEEGFLASSLAFWQRLSLQNDLTLEQLKELGRDLPVGKAAALGRLDQRLAELERPLAPQAYRFDLDPVAGVYRSRFADLSARITSPKVNPYGSPLWPKALEQAEGILSHPEKHFEADQAKEIRKAKLGTLQLRSASKSLVEQASGAGLDLALAFGWQVELQLEGTGYDVTGQSPTPAQMANYQALVEALSRSGVVRPSPFEDQQARGRFVLGRFAPLKEGAANLGFLTQGRDEEMLALIRAFRQAGLQSQEALGKTAQLARSLEQSRLETRYGADPLFGAKLNQLDQKRSKLLEASP